MRHFFLTIDKSTFDLVIFKWIDNPLDGAFLYLLGGQLQLLFKVCEKKIFENNEISVFIYILPWVCVCMCVYKYLNAVIVRATGAELRNFEH